MASSKNFKLLIFIEMPLIYIAAAAADYHITKSFPIKFTWLVLLIYSVRRDMIVHVISSAIFLLMITYETRLALNSAMVPSTVILGVSTLIALINNSRVHGIQQLTYDIRDREKEINDLKEKIIYLNSIIEDLKSRIFYEGEGLSTLFLRLKNIRTDNPKLFYKDFVETISTFFSIPGISVYRYRRGFFRLLAATKPTTLGFTFREGDSVVVDETLKKGYAKLIDLLDEKLSDVEPWMAIKIGEEPKGVLIVDEIDPVKLKKPYEKYLSSLCAWFDVMLERVEEFEILKNLRHSDGTYPIEVYEKLKNEHMNMAERGLPFSEICVCHDNLLELLRFFREDDIATKINIGGKECLKVLLPMCDEEGKEKIMKRLKGKFGDDLEICDVD